MARFRTAAAAALLIAAPALAQQAQDHTAHHPAPAAAQAQAEPAAAPQAGMAMCREMMGRMASMGQGMMGQGMMGQGMMGQGMMGQGTMGQGMGGMAARHERHVEGRLAFLKAELNIADAQAPQWTAFAEAVRANAKAASEAHRPTMSGATASPATLPERLAQQEKALAANLAGLKKVEDTLAKLYAVLNPDQKKIADGIVIGPMGLPTGMM